MDRRDFIQKAIFAACAVAATSITEESCSKSAPVTPSGPSLNFSIDISTPQYSVLQTNGTAVYANNVIIARDNKGNFIAIYDVCTHAGCTIQFDGTNQFPCPCHGSLFDENGNVVNGPAITPLKKYTATLNGTILHIQG
jgi:cytochrome b6-f complex iron-sulfur subunit